MMQALHSCCENDLTYNGAGNVLSMWVSRCNRSELHTEDWHFHHFGQKNVHPGITAKRSCAIVLSVCVHSMSMESRVKYTTYTQEVKAYSPSQGQFHRQDKFWTGKKA